MLLFQYIICYALLHFSLLKNLPLCVFMRQLLITAVWHLFNKCSHLSGEGSENLEDQLLETRPTKTFSDNTMLSPELKALLVHLWRSRKEKLHSCASSKATAGLDHSCLQLCRETNLCSLQAGSALLQAARASPWKGLIKNGDLSFGGSHHTWIVLNNFSTFLYAPADFNSGVFNVNPHFYIFFVIIK